MAKAMPVWWIECAQSYCFISVFDMALTLYCWIEVLLDPNYPINCNKNNINYWYKNMAQEVAKLQESFVGEDEAFVKRLSRVHLG